ncbi:MAG: RdgB/HAM1 family non-canonical purine NTP pyrophosphatase [Ignavibacteria bacterium]|nr:RdgB/HAM1 family non-canonical purine NTP pyrophosphatase [Ignavibacteria bacterium]
MTKLVLATRNVNKIKEIQSILKDLKLEFLTLNDFPGIPDLIEDGSTFQENSRRKAHTVYQHTKLLSLADDSGLEVFYLNKRPGVWSARYAGEGATDDENNEKLLKEMRGVPPRRRRAQFRALLTLLGDAFEESTEGICAGRLGEVPRGTYGFGYDPIFIPDGFTKTYAELTAEEKNTISHRAKALEKMREVLRRKVQSG